MYIDFEDYRPDIEPLGGAISRREGILLSIILHLVAVVVVVAPDLPFIKAASERAEAAAERQRIEALAQQQEEQRFVFVQPRVDTEAPAPPPRAELSDRDRVARAPERSMEPENLLPFARGNSPERVEAVPEEEARGRDPEPSAGEIEEQVSGEADGLAEGQAARDQSVAAVDPSGAAQPLLRRGPDAERRPSDLGGGALGRSLRNLDRYVQQESFGNAQGGGGAFGPAIQFDTKGVEFGPWVRRFIAQIKRNWFVPYAAMLMSGHAVITFNVHADGALTDVDVIAPSSVDSFNTAAFNALIASNPTQPLPPEYPDDRAFFTVTFYYNERPPR